MPTTEKHPKEEVLSATPFSTTQAAGGKEG